MAQRTVPPEVPEVLRPGSPQLRQIAGQHGLRLVVLFGSRARGAAHEKSDYDVAVLSSTRVAHRSGPLSASEAAVLRRLHARLQHLLQTSRVDLVLLDRASALLAHRVARDGIPVYEAEPGEFARFCVRAVQRKEDSRPFAEAERRYLEQRFSTQPASPRGGLPDGGSRRSLAQAAQTGSIPERTGKHTAGVV